MPGGVLIQFRRNFQFQENNHTLTGAGFKAFKVMRQHKFKRGERRVNSISEKLLICVAEPTNERSPQVNRIGRGEPNKFCRPSEQKDAPTRRFIWGA